MIDGAELLRMDICDMIFEMKQKVPRTSPYLEYCYRMIEAAEYFANEELLDYRTKKGKRDE